MMSKPRKSGGFYGPLVVNAVVGNGHMSPGVFALLSTEMFRRPALHTKILPEPYFWISLDCFVLHDSFGPSDFRFSVFPRIFPCKITIFIFELSIKYIVLIRYLQLDEYSWRILWHTSLCVLSPMGVLDSNVYMRNCRIIYIYLKYDLV